MIRRISVAAALTAALLMSGCGGDKPSGEPSGTPTTASLSPTPTATGPVAPVLPEAAKVNDDAGAKAFVEYWFAAVTYAMQTGDTKPFMAVSTDECAICANLEREIAGVYGAGGRYDGADWRLSRGLANDPSVSSPYRRYLVQVQQAAYSVTRPDGPVKRFEKELFPLRVTVIWRASSWNFLEGADGLTR